MKTKTEIKEKLDTLLSIVRSHNRDIHDEFASLRDISDDFMRGEVYMLYWILGIIKN